MSTTAPLRILYLVHDLNDAAVARRVGMLLEGGAEVELAGFFRGEAPPEAVRGVPARSLGRSFDARLGARAGAVLRLLLGARGMARSLAPTPDLILARNLEMLTVGDAIARGLRTRPSVVYECLDIHRLMVAPGWKGAVLRALEKGLLARTRLLIVSSPAFVEAHFEAQQGYRGEWMLVENKARAGPAAKPAPARRPWRIGWFGMLRCARSLAILADLARRSEGRVEVLLAGRPARTELADFDAIVADTPNLSYAGPYTAEDLPRLYGQVHFAWAIDYFEEGLNSTWLLPNRLYEGPAHGAVPIALASVQTGKWLAARGAGVLLDDPANDVPDFFRSLDAARLGELRAKIAAIPESDLTFDEADSRALVERLSGVAHG